LHHSSRSTPATPIHDIDAQSDAGSERSVTSPFVPQPSVTPVQHHQHHQQQAFPYHVHHSLLQRLTDMRDWYGGHLSTGGGSNH
jgi:hypothetical protein